MDNAFTFVNSAILNCEKTELIALFAVFAVIVAVTVLLASSQIRKRKQ